MMDPAWAPVIGITPVPTTFLIAFRADCRECSMDAEAFLEPIRPRPCRREVTCTLTWNIFLLCSLAFVSSVEGNFPRIITQDRASLARRGCSLTSLFMNHYSSLKSLRRVSHLCLTRPSEFTKRGRNHILSALIHGSTSTHLFLNIQQVCTCTHTPHIYSWLHLDLLPGLESTSTEPSLSALRGLPVKWMISGLSGQFGVTGVTGHVPYIQCTMQICYHPCVSIGCCVVPKRLMKVIIYHQDIGNCVTSCSDCREWDDVIDTIASN